MAGHYFHLDIRVTNGWIFGLVILLLVLALALCLARRGQIIEALVVLLLFLLLAAVCFFGATWSSERVAVSSECSKVNDPFQEWCGIIILFLFLAWLFLY